MRKLQCLMIALGLMLILGACGKDTAAENRPPENTVAQQTEQTETAAEAGEWEQYRAYLQENGDAVVEEDLSTDTDVLTKKTVIKGKDNEILVRFEMLNRQNVEGFSTLGKVTANFSLPEMGQMTAVDFHVEISASKGGKEEVATYEGTYDWDISQYAEGDDVVGTAIYNYVDVNGNYTHKNESVGYRISGIIQPVTDAMRKSLSESGLGITMAELGFVNY